MASDTPPQPPKRPLDPRELERRRGERLAQVRVLLADRDQRAARLVNRVLFSFGLRDIEIVTTGEQALELLQTKSYDFLITEWDMHPLSGIELIRAIRTARDSDRLRRDIPIIMLTANSEMDSVEIARDAGITEVIAKPFSAATISSRIIQLIDNPRAFVHSPGYTGPDRRRREGPPPGVDERRAPRGEPRPNVSIAAPDFRLRDRLGGLSARDLFNDSSITEAQNSLMAIHGDFVIWARDEVSNLRKAFIKLQATPTDKIAQRAMVDAAYAIKSQAGTFGYQLGTEIASLLLAYVTTHLPPTPDHLLVIGKYVDAVSVTFNENVEKNGQNMARDLIRSLAKLVEKFK